MGPQDNFYEWVNGKWLKDEENAIPEEYTSWGSFQYLHNINIERQIEMVKSINDDKNIIKCIWNANMDHLKHYNDMSPIIDEFNNLSITLENNYDIAKYLYHCVENGIGCMFNFDKGCDLTDSDNIKLDLAPSGLSLPNRDYYLSNKYSDKLEHFMDHLKKVKRLMGDLVEDNFCENVLAYETMLAEIRMPSEQAREYDKYYTRTTLNEFCTNINNMASHPDKIGECKLDAVEIASVVLFMNRIYKFLGLEKVMINNYGGDCVKGWDTMIVYDGDYFRNLFRIIFDINNFKKMVSYLKYKVIASLSGYCTKELSDEFFDFYSRKLGGQKERKSDEKRTIRLLNSWIGDLMGQHFVKKYFSQKDKQNVEYMINDILNVMKKSLGSNDWLTEETKKKALVKLSKFNTKIGYPNKVKDYTNLHITNNDTIIEMRHKVIQFMHKINFLDKINTKVDKEEWHMTPQTVNAYFSPQQNEIVFPAAILQPPFYHPTSNTIEIESKLEDNDMLIKASNYGGIGSVIAHEITHGYDDQGRKFDENGNLVDWWCKKDEQLFNAKTDLLTEQVNRYEYTCDGEIYKMNGKLTMGENLADLGGLTLAMRALGTQDINVLDVFFKSWALIWRCKMKKESQINRLATDPHAPTRFRANIVKNIDEFYKVYNVKKGDEMYLEEDKRVVMW